MKHWKTTINFEAWDEADAERMIQRMIAPVTAERRLLFAENPEETTEFIREGSTPSVRPDEWMDEGQPGEPSDVEIYGAGSA